MQTLTDPGEEEKAGWLGERGFITAKMVKRKVENIGELTFYIAGPPAFNQAMKKMLLKSLSVKKERLVMESFSGY